MDLFSPLVVENSTSIYSGANKMMTINVISASFERRGSCNPFHRHKWIPLAEHSQRRWIWPFPMDEETLQRARVCLKCSACKLLPDKKGG